MEQQVIYHRQLNFPKIIGTYKLYMDNKAEITSYFDGLKFINPWENKNIDHFEIKYYELINEGNPTYIKKEWNQE